MNILITGSSKGIGLATAKFAIEKGHKVGLFDIDETTLHTIATQPPFNTNNCIFAKMDVTCEKDWDKTITLMQQKLGGIDVLINNAGILVSGQFEQIDFSKHLSLLEINCHAVMMGCHKVKPYLTHKNSKIINLSSASAIYGQPEIASYSASKFFVRGLTEALDMEWRKQGIRVLDVMPLWVKSNMTQDVKVTSISRLGIGLTPNHVASVIIKLIDKPNQHIQATHFPVGKPASALYYLEQITPTPITRWLNQLVGVK